MNWAEQEYDWLLEKYGVPVKPWERVLHLRNEKNNSSGQFYIDDNDKYLWYCYSHTFGSNGNTLVEREPQNTLQIKDPATYNGYLGRKGNNAFDKTDKVWIVNGIINKADGEFNQHFNCWKIGNTGVVLGRVPMHEGDVQKARS